MNPLSTKRHSIAGTQMKSVFNITDIQGTVFEAFNDENIVDFNKKSKNKIANTYTKGNLLSGHDFSEMAKKKK